jgi:mRNA-degrading endonuclease RelE of RelBE toxin-antitoxin system
MTFVGSGGVVITHFVTVKSFDREYKKLPPEIKRLIPDKLKDLLNNPRPPGLGFEKLKGYKNPDIYTIHITGNYKMSFVIDGSKATLRHIGTHNDIDRQP